MDHRFVSFIWGHPHPLWDLNTYDQNASKCSASFRNISQFIGFNWYASTFQSPTSRTCLTSQPSLTSVTSLCRRTGRCTREDPNRRSALAGHVGSIWKVKGLSFKPYSRSLVGSIWSSEMENFGNEDVKIYLSFVDLWMNYIIWTWLGVLRTGPPSLWTICRCDHPKKGSPHLAWTRSTPQPLPHLHLAADFKGQGCLASRMLGWWAAHPRKKY